MSIKEWKCKRRKKLEFVFGFAFKSFFLLGTLGDSRNKPLDHSKGWKDWNHPPVPIQPLT